MKGERGCNETEEREREVGRRRERGREEDGEGERISRLRAEKCRRKGRRLLS